MRSIACRQKRITIVGPNRRKMTASGRRGKTWLRRRRTKLGPLSKLITTHNFVTIFSSHAVHVCSFITSLLSLFRLQEIEGEFEKHVSAGDLSTAHHDIDAEGLLSVYNYWVLKRRAAGNKPLVAPRSDDVDFMTRQQEQADHEKMRKFVQLRQDLERVSCLHFTLSRLMHAWL